MKEFEEVTDTLGQILPENDGKSAGILVAAILVCIFSIFSLTINIFYVRELFRWKSMRQRHLLLCLFRVVADILVILLLWVQFVLLVIVELATSQPISFTLNLILFNLLLFLWYSSLNTQMLFVVERFLGICLALSFEKFWKSRLIALLLACAWILAAVEVAIPILSAGYCSPYLLYSRMTVDILNIGNGDPCDNTQKTWLKLIYSVCLILSVVGMVCLDFWSFRTLRSKNTQHLQRSPRRAEQTANRRANEHSLLTQGFLTTAIMLLQIFFFFCALCTKKAWTTLLMILLFLVAHTFSSPCQLYFNDEFRRRLRLWWPRRPPKREQIAGRRMALAGSRAFIRIS